MIKMLLVLGILGHLLCAGCDCLLAFAGNKKRFSFTGMRDNAQMAEIMETMPEKNPMRSNLLGVFAIFLMFWGYLSVCLYVYPYSKVYAAILFVAAVLWSIPISAFHVFCGTAEWYYLRMGRTEQAHKAAMDFIKSVMPTGIISYLGQFVFCITLFIAVVTGVTELPKWALIFNHIIFVAVLQPLKVPGAGNLAGALTFAGLLFVM